MHYACADIIIVQKDEKMDEKYLDLLEISQERSEMIDDLERVVLALRNVGVKNKEKCARCSQSIVAINRKGYVVCVNCIENQLDKSLDENTELRQVIRTINLESEGY